MTALNSEFRVSQGTIGELKSSIREVYISLHPFSVVVEGHQCYMYMYFVVVHVGIV